MKNLYMQFFGKILFTAILFTVSTSSIQAQTIAAWDFWSRSSPATVAAEVYDANLSTTNTITRGSGAAASAGGNSFRTVGFQNNGIATTNTDYFQITLGAATGYLLSLSSIDAKFAGTSGFYATPGVTSQIAYSLDGTSFTLINSPVTSTSLTLATINLSGISALQNVPAGTTVTLRYYASGQTTTGGWGFSSSADNDYGLTIGGAVNCVTPTAAPVGTITATANPSCGATTLSFPASSVAGVDYYFQSSATGTSTTVITNGTANYTVNTTGTYYVRARSTGGCWSTTSVSSGIITINTPPAITTQPVNTTTSTSQTATFSVAATGTTLTYQWQVNTGLGFNNVVNGGVYSGATTSTLSVANPLISFSGYQYRVIVSGATPCVAVTSNAATLTVTLYCIPSISSACDEYISTVTINTLTNNSPSPFNCGATSNGYSDYSTLTTNVIKGQTYSISLGVGEIFTPDPSSGYTGDDIRIWADWNQNGNFTDPGETLVTLNNNGGAGAFSFTVPNTALTGNVRIRIRLVYDGETSSCGSATFGETEDYTLVVADPCTSGYTVSNFYPTSGPAGSWVRIVGTGFTNVTAVKFNNVAATTFTLVSTTVILARVPSNAGTGKITITNNVSCTYTTTASFAFLSYSGTCAGVGSYSDLLITEISDPASGNNHYIEIYNGTASAIDLNTPNNYAIQVTNDPSTTQTVDISGTIASGQIKVYYAGSNGGLASAPAQGTSNGFNDKDTIKLLKNGVIIDRVNTPTYVGYNYTRLTSVTSPSATFIAGQWTITPEPATQSTSGLGVYNVTPTLTLTTPADVASCSITFSVTANPVAGTTFQWKYNDLNTATGWTNLTNGTVLGATISGATTNTVTITGDLTVFNNYQFYVEAVNSGCTASSNAAQFTLNADRFFKTAVVTGNWSAANTWLMATSLAGPWTSACTYPTGTSSDYISIENGAVITLDVNPITVDQLIIQSGGNLIHPAGTALTIGNGASGSDFTVDGLYTDNSLTTTVFSTGATWSMGAAGTLVKTNNSGAGIWQTNYEGGIATIPATGNWIIRYNGTNANIPFISIGAYYPNLTFESVSGVWVPGTLTKYTGLSGFATIKGTLDVGGTGSGTVNALIIDNTNATPLQVLGNLIVRSGSTLTNSGNADGTGIEVKGNVTLDGTLTLSSNGTGLLKLSGNTDQNITGTGTINLQNFTINNSGTAIVQVNRNVPVLNTLTFVTGSKINLASGNIVMRSTASLTSRIAVIPSGVNINYGSGKFVVERYLPVNVHGKSWQLLSVPVNTSQTINQAWQDTATVANQSRYNGYGLQITSNINPLPAMFDVYTPAGPSMKVYNYLTDSWDGVPNTTGTAITNPNGYMTFVRGDRTVITSSQAATATTIREAGEIYTPTNLPPAVTVAANAFESVGNPYASPVDFTTIIKSANIQNAFYVWDPTLSGAFGLGGFQTIVPPNWYPIPGGTVNYPANTTFKNIQSGQAFFVRSFGGSGTVSFQESSKTSGNVDVFRTNSRLGIATISATLYGENDGRFKVVDGNIVSFHPTYTNRIDANDIIKIRNMGGNFGIYNQNVILVSEQRKLFVPSDSVQYHIQNLRPRNYRFKISAHEFITNLPLVLWDRFTGSRSPLSTNGDTLVYDFSVNQEAGSYAPNRFVILNGKKQMNSSIRLAIINDQLEWKTEGDFKNFRLESSSDGRKFDEFAFLSGNQYSVTVPLTGNYLRLTGVNDESNQVSNVVQRIGRGNMNVHILSNPVTNQTLMFTMEAVPGNYSVIIIDELGKKILEKRILHNSDFYKLSLSLNGTMKGVYNLEIMNKTQKVSKTFIVL